MKTLRPSVVRVFALCIMLCSAGSTLAVCELVARRLCPAPQLTECFPCRGINPQLGGGFRPNCTSRWTRDIDGQRVFDIRFASDRFGRRITPQERPEERHRLAVFLGCSFTVGVGVEAAETLPARVAALSPAWRVLNYGGSGFGPQQALVTVDRRLSADELGAWDGAPLAVYTMIPDHVARAAGSWLVLGTFGRFFPAYRLDASSVPVAEGSFAEAHPWRVGLADAIEGSALLRRIPEPQGAAAVELTARLVLAASQRFSERFPGGRFVVVAYPGAWRGDEPVLGRMRALGLTVLEAPDLFGHGLSGPRLADGHPTPESYARVAAWLVGALGL